ncbi:TPA: helix-turn-helix domain-containing protein [Pasteurella multocida]|uniref:helix-turn-helix domain-containing protein n=1 Tax=Pasteurella multocida TaxID=747 RepID=UPI002944E21B|nr:helix-turn-helix domain-containing protein [Pasteurella multocida]MEB3481087.1 helix-turn-helix domain-containing protein [Pasteurella multocida]HDR1048313.1 helix-turn-helix domain-containing protein [Pasteurella multocida]HDR1138951.1 helix-turn-helix domain-containing protein [Pasteurella multocida]HED4432158.1 helix-turn-helix domain-containing protein [Pasteurella multocida]HEP0888934.1 helix-turn-helix domain-containing protein [Pasteurella multocida]
MTGIKKVVDICGSQKKLADLCKVSQQAVNKWVKGGKIDVKYIPAIIKATNGKVTAEEIRPDVDWAVIKGVN